MSQTQIASKRLEGPVPLQPAGTVEELYPPMCLRSHWDPGMILRWTLPDQKVDLPLDFRPYVKVCKDYVTSAPAVVGFWALRAIALCPWLNWFGIARLRVLWSYQPTNRHLQLILPLSCRPSPGRRKKCMR